MTIPESPSFNPDPDAGSEGNKTEQELIAETSARLFVRELPPEYRELILGKSHFIELGSPYSDHLSHHAGREKGRTEWMKNKMAGETILDLGCGSSGNMEDLSVNEWGAKQYIGVDINRTYNPKSDEFIGKEEAERVRAGLLEFLKEESKKIDKVTEPVDKPVPTESRIVNIHANAIYIRGDMLDCISKLEDGSVGAVSMSGIEILGSRFTGDNSPRYMKALKKEIVRVLKPGGVFISYESDICPDDDNQLTKVFSIGHGLESNGIYQKISS
jgi:SAM-dependent methyltransferase